MASRNSGTVITLFAYCALVAGILLSAGGTTGVRAHKLVTSKYTYTRDVLPILRERCGRCHWKGGPAPMSLLAYNDEAGSVVAWAESIREMLVAETMPPWYADPTGPAVRNNGQLTARELDILVTWAVGGTPEGERNHRPGETPMTVRWGLGEPDVELILQEHALPAGKMEDVISVSLSSGLKETKWIRAADLLPGTPSIVRRATIQVDNGPILALWQPGDDPVEAPSGTAFRIAAGARLQVRIEYKKRWEDEQETLSDRSRVGLYFTEEPLSGKEIRTFIVNGSEFIRDAPSRTFGGTLPEAGRVLSVRPSLDQPYRSMQIYAVVPSGRRVPLLKLRAPRPEWSRRYWLAEPVELPTGTKIEVATSPLDSGQQPNHASSGPLQVALDIVTQ